MLSTGILNAGDPSHAQGTNGPTCGNLQRPDVSLCLWHCDRSLL